MPCKYWGPCGCVNCYHERMYFAYVQACTLCKKKKNVKFWADRYKSAGSEPEDFLRGEMYTESFCALCEKKVSNVEAIDLVIQAELLEFVRVNPCALDLLKKTNTTPPVVIRTEKLLLIVPFARKDEAKKMGAKWDFATKSWYATSMDSPLLKEFKLK